MDNCSPDGTPEVVRSFNDPRVKHVRNNINLGHIRNFNSGIQLAQGEYVWLASADDFLNVPDALDRYITLFGRNRNLGFAFCRATTARHRAEAHQPLEWTNLGKRDRIWKSPGLLRALLPANRIVMSSVLARKRCYQESGFFLPELPYAADWHMWNTFAMRYDAAYVAEAMVCWRVHEESLTSAFQSGPDPVRISDELAVLFRMARAPEIKGTPALRRICNVAIGARAGNALSRRCAPDRRLTESKVDALLRDHITDSRDEKEIRASIAATVGDTQFWDGEYVDAMRSYRSAIALRPWSVKAWTKYLLLQLGSTGASIRRFATAMTRRST